MTATKVALGVGCGILLGAGALLATCAGCVGLVGTQMAEQESQKKQALTKVRFEDVRGDQDEHFVTIEGKVRNDGDNAVAYVKVGVEILDGTGKVLDTDWTYAVSGEGLNPGAAKSFKIMTPTDERMEKYRYFVMQDD